MANLGRRKTFLSLDDLRSSTGLDAEDQQDIEEELLSAEKLIEAESQLKVMKLELASLDEPHRVVLELFYLAEMSIEEISSITKTKPGTVKARLSRGRGKLRKVLQPFKDPSV